MIRHWRCVPCKSGQSTYPGHTDVCSKTGQKLRDMAICPNDINLVCDSDDMQEIKRRAKNGDEVAIFLLGGVHP
jgi:hypothetical protein